VSAPPHNQKLHCAFSKLRLLPYFIIWFRAMKIK
jgi:hypothetical protein